MTLGFHWLATASGCDPAKIRDRERVREVLDRLGPTLGLTAVGGPAVHVNDDGSLVGFVLLAESHASMHVPPQGDGFLADVFSCVSFDAEVAAELLVDAFGGNLQGRIVER